MSDYWQNELPCVACGGPHYGALVAIDMSPEGRGAHQPICHDCLQDPTRWRVGALPLDRDGNPLVQIVPRREAERMADRALAAGYAVEFQPGHVLHPGAPDDARPLLRLPADG